MAEHFFCQCCHGYFPVELDENQLVEQFKKEFPEENIEETVLVKICDPCFKMIMSDTEFFKDSSE